MKKIAVIAMLALGFSLNAQVNKNVTKETKTTTVTVDDGTEKKRIVKTEGTDTEQEIEFKQTGKDKLNKDIANTPTKVTKTEVLQGDDMETKVGRATYYSMNGKNYMFVSNKNGYKISSTDNLDYGTMKRTDDNKYSCEMNGKSSVGYFDDNGNLVVETKEGNNKMVETYTLIKK